MVLTELIPGFARRKVSQQQSAAAGYWVPDSSGKSCYDCERPFSFLNRKHHCRICGFIFCLQCIQPGNFLVSTAEHRQASGRVCRYCYSLRRPLLDTQSSLLQAPSDLPSSALSPSGLLEDPGRGKGRAQPEQRLAAGPQPAITQPSATRTLQTLGMEQGTAFPAHTLAALSGWKWQGDRPGIPGYQPQGSPAIPLHIHGQGMPEAKPPTNARTPDGASAALPPLPHAATAARQKRKGRTEPHAVSIDGALLWDPPGPLETPQTLTESKASSHTLPGDGHGQGHPLSAVYRLPLSVVAEQHLAALAAQLLRAEHVDDVGAWCPVLTFLALEAASAVSPTAMAAFGVRDPRFYIKAGHPSLVCIKTPLRLVKKVPDGGSPEESCFVHGLACRKNLTHRRMRKSITNARVLLLASRLESHRTQHRLASFDHYTNDQETAHLKLAVARLTQLQPDVLLVEKSVARNAQEELLANGVSLALNVKRSTLDRVARCTGAQVALSVEDISQSCIGHCQEFKVEDVQPAAERGGSTAPRPEPGQDSSAADRGPGGRAVMFIKGCPHALGCTILLKGCPLPQLKRVKKVARFVTFAAYRCRLESTFLADELASATFAAAEAGTPPASGHDDAKPVTDSMDVVSSPDLSRPFSMRSMPLAGQPSQAAPTTESELPGHRHSSSDIPAVPHRPAASGSAELAWPPTRADSQGGSAKHLHTSASAPGIAAYDLGARNEGAPKLDVSAFSRSQLQWQAEQTVQLSADMAAAERCSNIIASTSPHVSTADIPGCGEQDASSSSPNRDNGASDAGKQVPRSPALVRSLFPHRSSNGAVAAEQPGSRAQDAGTDAQQISSPGTLKAALGVFERLAAEQSSTTGTPVPRDLDPLSIAAQELISKDHTVSQSSAVFDAVLEELSEEQDRQGGLVVDMQHLHLTTASRNLLRGLVCEPARVERRDFYTGSDVSLAAFLASMQQLKCGCCGDGPSTHLVSYLHGGGLISFSVTRLAQAKALPGSEHGQIWFWARPLEAGSHPIASAGRVPLSPEASCLSLAHFFELSFGARYLELQGRSLHTQFARYFGLGQLVACFLHEEVECNDVVLPPPELSCQAALQQEWLTFEIDSLIEEANAAFRAINMALAQADVRIQAAKAASPASTAAAGEKQAASVRLLQEALATEGQGLSDMVQDVCTSVLPSTETIERPEQGDGSKPAAAVDNATLVSSLWQINRLRRSLAVLAMTWSARLQEPAMLSPESAAMGSSTSLSPAPSWASSTNAAFLQAPRSSADHVTPRPDDTAPRLPHSRSLLGLDSHEQDSQASADPQGQGEAGAHAPASKSLDDSISRSQSCPLVDSPSGSRHGPLGTHADPCLKQSPPLASDSPEATSSSPAASLQPAQATPSAADMLRAVATSAAGPQRPPEPEQEAAAQSRSPDSIPRGMVAQRRALWEQPVIQIPAWAPLRRANTASDSVLHWLNQDRQGSPRSIEPLGPLASTSHLDATAAASDTDEGTDADDEGSESGRSDRSHADAHASQRRKGMSRFARDAAGPDSSMPPLKVDLANVRSHLQRGEGGALSPTVLHAPARAASRTVNEDAVQLSGSEAGLSDAEDMQFAIHGTDTTPDNEPPAEQGPGTHAEGAGEGAEPSQIHVPRLRREDSQFTSHFDTDYWGQMLGSMRAQDQASNSMAGAMASSASLHLNSGGPRMPDAGAIASSSAASSPVIAALGKGLLMSRSASGEHLSSSTAPSRRADPPPGLVPYGQVKLSGRALLPPGVGERVIVVRDDEPTSIIAFFLSSRDYQAFLDKALANVLYGSSAPSPEEGGRSHRQASISSAGSPGRGAPGPDAVRSGEGRHWRTGSADLEPGAAQESPRPVRTDSAARGAGGPTRAAAGVRPDVGAEWKVLLSREPMHFEHAVTDDAAGQPGGKARLQVTAWFAPQFAELRRRVVVGGEEAYLASLSRCRPWEARGGKTRSYFAKTCDDRYIVKQLQSSEKRSFPEIAPSYFRYLAHAMRKSLPTCLAKIMGIYTVSVRAGTGREAPMDLLVMENIFYAGALSPIFDLKGSERARLARDDPGDPTRVLLDQNLLQRNLGSPILIEGSAYSRLLHALWSDTAFLAGLGVMDYSLLVGIDKTNNSLVVGIIDFIRQYTWDKALERWVKSGMGLSKDRKAPTIQSPKEYCRRFRLAMTAYFTLVPSSSYQAETLDPDEGL